MYYYILFWVCVIGLCMGSFYNVVILRSLSNESIVFPPSKCPKCNHKLFAWHNIPVLSYILLGGKCYFCKEKISIQYPIVELITMLLFVLTYLKFGISLKTLFALVWVSGFIIMTVTDIKQKIVDCNIAIIVAIFGLIYNSLTYGMHGFIFSLLGLILGFAIIEAIARLGFLVSKTRAMGEADSYVAGAMGAIFGFPMIIIALFCSLFLSMVFIFPMFIYKRFKAGDIVTCVFSLLFIFSIIIFEFLSQNYLTLGLLAGMGGVLAYRIIKSIKASSLDCSYLPFVPALCAGTLVVLFFMS